MGVVSRKIELTHEGAETNIALTLEPKGSGIMIFDIGTTPSRMLFPVMTPIRNKIKRNTYEKTWWEDTEFPPNWLELIEYEDA